MIRELTPTEAGPFIKKWHYSGTVPRGKNFYYGWFVNNELYAVANYGIGVNCYQAAFLSRETGYNINLDTLVELKRLCRSEPKLGAFPLTKFLSGCNKLLKARGILFIVSFSDPAHGHDGGIYKAASFRWLGKTQEEWHLTDKDGNTFHRRRAYRHAKARNITMKEARAELGLKRVKTQAKDRWFFALKKIKTNERSNSTQTYRSY